jgi:hypothetical protein
VVLAGHPGLIDCVKKDGVLVDVDQRKVGDLVATSHDCDLADALFPDAQCRGALFRDLDDVPPRPAGARRLAKPR